MFSVEALRDQVNALAEKRIDLDAFEDWFVPASWGYFDVHGDPLSRAIAAVQRVLRISDENGLDETQIARELANAVPRSVGAISPKIFHWSDSPLTEVEGESKSVPGDGETFWKDALPIPPPASLSLHAAIRA